jgi:Xaa-Pro aminopeptidase
VSRYEPRLQRVREGMDKASIAAIYLMPSGDLEYVTGLRRRRPGATTGHQHGDWLTGALVTSSNCVVVTSHLASHFMHSQMPGKPWLTDFVHIPEGGDLDAVARRLIDAHGLGRARVAVPREARAETMLRLQALFPAMMFTLTAELITPLRMIKDDEELAIMRRGALACDAVFADIMPKLRVGMTEVDVFMEVERLMLKHGAEGSSFVTGVMITGGTAPIAATLEGVTRAGAVDIQPGRVVAFDFGVVLDGYASDFGRTVFVGDPPADLRRIHDIVMQSQAAGNAALRPGARTVDVDQAARRVIEDAGYGKEFFHRLGHGIGIDVHEPPFLATGDSGTVEANMCFTVEPSVWIPERCFIRVEDVVVAAPGGGYSLNQASRSLHVI